MAGRCSDNVSIGKIGYNKLAKLQELYFTILNDLDTCTCVDMRNAIVDNSITPTPITAYKPFLRPTDALSCAPDKCRNTGTRTVTIESGADGTFFADAAVRYDATEFYAGILTAYIYCDTPGSYYTNVTIGDIQYVGIPSIADSNAYTYRKNITFEEPGFKLVVIDLADVPQVMQGTGWEPTTRGAWVRFSFSISEETLAADTTFGFSTLCLHDDTTDFETADTVVFSCLESLTNDLTLDPVDASCWGQGYDETSPSVEVSFTAKSATPNVWKINPMARRGDATEGFYPFTDEKVVTSVTIDGVTYGMVQFPDISDDECGFVAAAINDECNTTDAELSRVFAPVPMNLSERQFQVITDYTSEYYNSILVHEDLIGSTITVVYPRRATIEEIIVDDKDLNHRNVKLSFITCTTDGIKYNYVFENVLVTAFPLDFTATDEYSWDITLTIMRNKKGRFYTIQRILDQQ